MKGKTQRVLGPISNDSGEIRAVVWIAHGLPPQRGKSQRVLGQIDSGIETRRPSLTEVDALDPREATLERKPAGMSVFLGTLLALVLLRTALGYVVVPPEWGTWVSAITSAIFLGLPIVALYFAGAWKWTPGRALLFVAAGMVVQFGLYALVRQPVIFHSPFVNLIAGLSQAGLPIWTVGLGALIATLLKDKNMILPIAIVLAILDMLLVFTPVGTVNQVLRKAPVAFTSVALSVPKVRTHAEPQAPRGAALAPAAYAGPADFVFLSMFFVALFRFEMRTKETLLWVIPALIVYMGLTGLTHMSLPAMVPIGLVVLIVNAREFKLTMEEAITTGVFAALALGLLIYGLTRPGLQAAPLPTEPAPRARSRADSLAPVSPGPRPSQGLPGVENTPSPR